MKPNSHHRPCYHLVPNMTVLCSLTCILMPFLIKQSLQTKGGDSQLFTFKKAPEAVERDSVPPPQALHQRAWFLSLSCMGSKASLHLCVHKSPFQMFSMQVTLHHTTPFPQKPWGGQETELTAPRCSGHTPCGRQQKPGRE